MGKRAGPQLREGVIAAADLDKSFSRRCADVKVIYSELPSYRQNGSKYITLEIITCNFRWQNNYRSKYTRRIVSLSIRRNECFHVQPSFVQQAFANHWQKIGRKKQDGIGTTSQNVSMIRSRSFVHLTLLCRSSVALSFVHTADKDFCAAIPINSIGRLTIPVKLNWCKKNST